MRFPFHLITEYAHSFPNEMRNASLEFFGQNLAEDDEDPVVPLFVEFIIFEYIRPPGTIFIKDYVSQNPHKLPPEKINQLTQVSNTHHFSQFELTDIKPNVSLDIEDLLTGKTYRVYDTLGSSNAPKHGTLFARIGKVDGKWYMVGSNPIIFPLVHTQRLKRILRKERLEKQTSVKDVANILWDMRKAPNPKILSLTEIFDKRVELKKEFDEKAEKYKSRVPFKQITDEVFNETDTKLFKFWEKLIKKGLPEMLFFENNQLFQDIWNYFPHKVLKGKSPMEMLAERMKRT